MLHMTFLELVRSLIERVFGGDPGKLRKRAELRKLYAILDRQPLPYYRPKQNQVLPGFAETLFAWARTMRPLHDLVLATVAHTDSRVAQKHIDFLIECRIPAGDPDRVYSFNYETICDSLLNSLDPEKDIDALEAKFRDFIAGIDQLGGRQVNEDLDLVERFVDIVRFDCGRFLAMFDPAVSFDSRSRHPGFSPLDADQALPELLDLHYVLKDFVFEPTLRDDLTRLFAHHSKTGLDETKLKKLTKIFEQLDSALSGPLSPTVILTLIRALKSDPECELTAPRERKDHLAAYRHRVVSQFEKDIARVRHERQESTVMADLAKLFLGIEFMTVDGYDEETDSYLRKETPNGLLWIKPFRALRTFIVHIFEPAIFEPVTKLLLEGNFDNKEFQNNVANILYQCEKSSQKVSAFEVQISGSGRYSMTAIRRYVEEMKKGKDLAPFLARLIDSVNEIAFDLIRNETEILAMLGHALAEVTADSSHTSTAVVPNLRKIGGGRNRQFLAQLNSAQESFTLFTRIMRSFGILAARDNTVAVSTDPEAVPVLDVAEIEAEPPRSGHLLEN